MSVNRTTLLFFDASCLIAAAGSPNGGSGFLLSLCARQLLCGAVSHMVLLEAEHNIHAKMRRAVLARYHELLQIVSFTVAPVPALDIDAPWTQQINAKDLHEMIATRAANADYLLTLDQNLIREVTQADVALPALTPGDFIRTILPTHDEFPRLR